MSRPHGDGPVIEPRFVDELHGEVADRITKRLARLRSDSSVEPSFDDERALGHEVIAEVLEEWSAAAHGGRRARLSPVEEDALAQKVHDRIYGLGDLQPLVDHPDYVDIHAYGHDEVWIRTVDGLKTRGPKVADSDAALVRQVANYARQGLHEVRWDREVVALNLQLPNGARLHALNWVTPRPVIDIRRHNFRLFRLEQLEGGLVDRAIREFLAALVRAKHNVVVAGAQGTAKTTLVRCLINEVPPEERVIVAEDSPELGIERFKDLHPDQVRIDTRAANTEGRGAFTLTNATRESLRMMGDRVIVGEVRGGELIAMLLAMTQGEDGSMCTMHAGSVEEVWDRLLVYGAMSEMKPAPEVTAMMVANTVRWVVYLAWDAKQQRRVAAIREVVGADGKQIVSNAVWDPDPLGRAVPTGVRLTERSERQLVEAGFDLSLLDRPRGWWDA
jgi:pilus assembly protein CpaF